MDPLLETLSSQPYLLNLIEIGVDIRARSFVKKLFCQVDQLGIATEVCIFIALTCYYAQQQTLQVMGDQKILN